MFVCACWATRKCALTQILSSNIWTGCSCPYGFANIYILKCLYINKYMNRGINALRTKHTPRGDHVWQYDDVCHLTFRILRIFCGSCVCRTHIVTCQWFYKPTKHKCSMSINWVVAVYRYFRVIAILRDGSLWGLCGSILCACKNRWGEIIGIDANAKFYSFIFLWTEIEIIVLFRCIYYYSWLVFRNMTSFVMSMYSEYSTHIKAFALKSIGGYEVFDLGLRRIVFEKYIFFCSKATKTRTIV